MPGRRAMTLNSSAVVVDVDCRLRQPRPGATSNAPAHVKASEPQVPTELSFASCFLQSRSGSQANVGRAARSRARPSADRNACVAGCSLLTAAVASSGPPWRLVVTKPTSTKEITGWTFSANAALTPNNRRRLAKRVAARQDWRPCRCSCGRRNQHRTARKRGRPRFAGLKAKRACAIAPRRQSGSGTERRPTGWRRSSPCGGLRFSGPTIAELLSMPSVDRLRGLQARGGRSTRPSRARARPSLGATASRRADPHRRSRSSAGSSGAPASGSPAAPAQLHRQLSRPAMPPAREGRSWEFVHIAIDDATRLAYRGPGR